MPTRGILVKANFALLNERVEKLIHQKRPLPFRTKLRIAEDEPEEGAVRPSSKNKVRTIAYQGQARNFFPRSRAPKLPPPATFDPRRKLHLGANISVSVTTGTAPRLRYSLCLFA